MIPRPGLPAGLYMDICRGGDTVARPITESSSLTLLGKRGFFLVGAASS
jgi:hypothetical protein